MSDSVVSTNPDEEWKELMDQLRAQPKGQPGPFFYGRVRARLDTRLYPSRSGLPGWLRRPVYAAVLGALVLLLSGDAAALPDANARTYPNRTNTRQ